MPQTTIWRVLCRHLRSTVNIVVHMLYQTSKFTVWEKHQERTFDGNRQHPALRRARRMFECIGATFICFCLFAGSYFRCRLYTCAQHEKEKAHCSTAQWAVGSGQYASVQKRECSKAHVCVLESLFLLRLRLCVARCGSGGRGSEWVGAKGSRVRLVRNKFALDFEFEEQRDVLLDELPDHFAAARALDAA